MNIGLDARILVTKKTGIGYYLNDLLINILENDRDNIYFLFSDRKVFFDIQKYKNVRIIEDCNSKIFKKTLWYVFKVPRLIKKYKIDIFWGTQHVLPIGLNKNIKTVLTMHDLVCYEMPETMNTYNKIINRLLIPYSVKKADSIIAVSNSTKEGIIKYFNDIDKEKIRVIYESANVNLPDQHAEEKYLNDNKEIKSGKYLLYIGTIEPRKNIDSILNSFELIREKISTKLVICGKIGWKSEDFLTKIKDHKYSSDIIYKNYVTDEEKFILMKNSMLFIFPSFYEGFGLPVVEAMKCGTVPIISNSSSLDELIEIKELKFAPTDYKKLAEKIVDIYFNNELYTKAKEYCKKRVDFFDWNKFSKEYIEVFKNLNKNRY